MEYNFEYDMLLMLSNVRVLGHEISHVYIWAADENIADVQLFGGGVL